MDLCINADNCYTEPRDGQQVYVEVRGADETEILEHISVGDAVSHFNIADVLNELDEDDIRTELGIVDEIQELNDRIEELEKELKNDS